MVARGRPRQFDRDAALRRAMQAFWDRGYEGTSIADLVAAMGINAPSLYAAFGSKEALFREAVDLYNRDSPAARAFREQPTAKGAVAAMLRQSVDSYTQPRQPRGCMVVLAAPTCAPENEDVRSLLAECRTQAQKALRRRFERAIDEGELPTGCDSEALAGFYTAVLQGLSIQARDGASRKSLMAVADSAAAAWDTLTRRGTG